MLTVVLIGRTNVGKSTLFNRIIGERRAMTSELPHTTRDRNVGMTTWRDVALRVIDTGGVDDVPRGEGVRRGRTATIEGEIRCQVALAITDADLLLLVVDARDGILPGERMMSRELRRIGKPVLVAWNKAETKRLREASPEAAALGFGDAYPTSALTGAGIGDLLDRIVEHRAGNSAPRTSAPPAVRLAIVGEPNVGKSSLLNAILGREEVIVHPEPFTTRDVHDVEVEINGATIVLLDTAGIRRLAVRAVRGARTRLEAIERIAVTRSLAAIERADVVILVLDATRPATRHTKQLAETIVDVGRACIIVVNKMDLVESATREPEREPTLIADRVHHLFPHLSWVPVLETSAHTGTNVPDILPTALRTAAAWRRACSPPQLAAVHALVKQRIPIARSRIGRRRSHLLEIRQTGTAPPTFLLRTRRRVKLPRAIPAIVERALRESEDFAGTPIRITIASVKG